ncbi:MAG: endonuclease domain-containing protein [Pseudolysinimonas sp.]
MFAPLLGPHDAFSHATAALLHGAELPWEFERSPTLHVSRVGDTRFRRPGVRGHRVRRMQVCTVDGLPVVSPAHTWVQLAATLSHDDLVAVGDRWVTPRGPWRARRPPLTSIDALAGAIDDHAGERGVARARIALRSVRVGSESRMETRLRLLLVGAGLPEPELNPAVPVGGRVLHPDLLFRQWGLVLEYEGDGHRTDPTAWRRDISRREALQSAGYRVLQVHSDDMHVEPQRFLARVSRVISECRRAGGS